MLRQVRGDGEETVRCKSVPSRDSQCSVPVQNTVSHTLANTGSGDSALIRADRAPMVASTAKTAALSAATCFTANLCSLSTAASLSLHCHCGCGHCYQHCHCVCVSSSRMPRSSETKVDRVRERESVWMALLKSEPPAVNEVYCCSGRRSQRHGDRLPAVR